MKATVLTREQGQKGAGWGLKRLASKDSPAADEELRSGGLQLVIPGRKQGGGKSDGLTPFLGQV